MVPKQEIFYLKPFSVKPIGTLYAFQTGTYSRLESTLLYLSELAKS